MQLKRFSGWLIVPSFLAGSLIAAGPSARLLSVAERAILAALAPQLGAAAVVFVSDEKTEVYLRDQRRSKAHRGLLPDPGAPSTSV